MGHFLQNTGDTGPTLPGRTPGEEEKAQVHSPQAQIRMYFIPQYLRVIQTYPACPCIPFEHGRCPEKVMHSCYTRRRDNRHSGEHSWGKCWLIAQEIKGPSLATMQARSSGSGCLHTTLLPCLKPEGATGHFRPRQPTVSLQSLSASTNCQGARPLGTGPRYPCLPPRFIHATTQASDAGKCWIQTSE